MKRKLMIFALLIAVFAIFLAVGVSADTIYRDGEGNELFSFKMNENSIIAEYNGEFPKYDSHGNALTWYVVQTAQEGENTVKTVNCVLTTDENYFSISNGVYSYKTSTVTNLNVVSVCFPNDAGITKLNIANAGYRLGNMYTYNPNGSEILFCYLPNTLTELPERIVQASKALICDMPSDMPITKISYVAFHSSKCLREINIPSTVTEIMGMGERTGSAFYDCTSLKKVTFGENSQLVKIGTQAFYKCGIEQMVLPDSVTTIESHAFSYTKLVNSPFTENSQCQFLGGRAFSDIPTLENIIIPSSLTKADILGDLNYGPFAESGNSEKTVVVFAKGDNIQLLPSFFGKIKAKTVILPEGPTEVPSYYFTDAIVGEIVLSNTIETVKERAIQGTTVGVFRFGANFKYFSNSKADNHSFSNGTKGLSAFYIPKTFYQEAPDTVYQVSYAFACGSSGNIKFYYTGSQADLAIALENFKTATKAADDNNWKFTGATQISYLDYIANEESYQNGNYIIYDYNNCDAFYDSVHLEDGNPCVINCDRCGAYGEAEKNPQHNISLKITYESYTSNGYKTVGCINDGCKDNVVEELLPLVTSKGYSQDTTSKAIVLDMSFNREAILEYENYLGEKISFGVVASLKHEDSQPLSSDGSERNGAVKVDFTDAKYSIFQLKITNLSDANKQLHCSGYMLVGNNITYINGKEASSTAVTLTYNNYTGKEE